LDNDYEPYYKTKNYQNEIPQNELNLINIWNDNHYIFDENVSQYGGWVTVNESARLPAVYVYASKQKQAIKKIKGIIKQ
jgi:hypothetical protein